MYSVPGRLRWRSDPCELICRCQWDPSLLELLFDMWTKIPKRDLCEDVREATSANTVEITRASPVLLTLEVCGWRGFGIAHAAESSRRMELDEMKRAADYNKSTDTLQVVV